MSALEAIPLKRIDGAQASLADWAGQVRLVVNVASACGLTPQYAGLEKLYADHKAEGLVVLGFPANDFGGQEPGTNEEIAAFCTTRFGASFPMFEKLAATGPGKHPLYAALTADGPELQWNFEKFLIGRDGEVAARFNPRTPPDDPALLAAIEAELAK